MTDSPINPGPDDLRRRAEEIVAQREPALKASESDTRRLVHELQVHQIELEMQNEALLQAQSETQKALDRLVDLNARLEEEVAARTAALMVSEARATHILESSADGLYGIDAQGRITFINPAACALLGIHAEQALGESAHRMFHAKKSDGSAYPADQCPAQAALKHGKAIRVDTEVYWHADGHAIPVMYAVHPLIKEGKADGAVISVVDMTAQRAAGAAREKALEAAENLARLRSEFMANMSHEIRTPLNGVLGFADIGARKCKDPEAARRAFEQIKLSGQRLLGVINDILEFSRIEAGRLKIETIPVSLQELVDQTMMFVTDRVKSKQLDLKVNIAPDVPQTFLGDPLRIGQVLLNLLSNAVKFTASGGISLWVLRDRAQLIFRVTDTGIGMDEAQVRELFLPFQQADGSTTRKFGGSGLGLFISRRIVELMNGAIEVESQPGIGSTFTVRFPYLAAASPVAQSAADPPPRGAVKPLAGLTMLVAEDDPVSQMIIEEDLKEFGARVVLVENGVQAVERVTRDGPAAYDIVLMDVQMSKMDGYAATRLLRELAPALPVIGQTAHALGEEKAKCLAAGMVDHIAKPINPDEMLKAILRHVTPRTGP